MKESDVPILKLVTIYPPILRHIYDVTVLIAVSLVLISHCHSHVLTSNRVFYKEPLAIVLLTMLWCLAVIYSGTQYAQPQGTRKWWDTNGGQSFPATNNMHCPEFYILENTIFRKQRLRLWRMASSGMLRRVALVRIDVSEELSASFIRVPRDCELGTTLAVTSNRRMLISLSDGHQGRWHSVLYYSRSQCSSTQHFLRTEYRRNIRVLCTHRHVAMMAISKYHLRNYSNSTTDTILQDMRRIPFWHIVE
jgi:hypothetical protein